MYAYPHAPFLPLNFTIEQGKVQLHERTFPYQYINFKGFYASVRVSSMELSSKALAFQALKRGDRFLTAYGHITDMFPFLCIMPTILLERTVWHETVQHTINCIEKR